MGQFAANFEFGATGEDLATGLLSEFPRTAWVRDLHSDLRWQKFGVDLLWSVRRRTIAVEVKYERRSTGNLVLETLSNTGTRRPGWWITSHAHLVVYGFQDTGTWWVLHLPSARQVIRGDRLRGLRSIQASTGHSYRTTCRLLPLAMAQELGVVARWEAMPRSFIHDAPHVGLQARLGAKPPEHSCGRAACVCGGRLGGRQITSADREAEQLRAVLDSLRAA